MFAAFNYVSVINRDVDKASHICGVLSEIVITIVLSVKSKRKCVYYRFVLTMFSLVVAMELWIICACAEDNLRQNLCFVAVALVAALWLRQSSNKLLDL